MTIFTEIEANKDYFEIAKKRIKNANSEEQALQLVKNSIQDPRVRDYIRLQVCKEVKLDS